MHRVRGSGGPRRRLVAGVAVAALALTIAPAGSQPPANEGTTRPDMAEAAVTAGDRVPTPPSRAAQASPADPYAMAGGCYGIQSVSTGGYVVREGEAFRAVGEGLASAEPFRFEATGLGRYLLHGSQGDFLAAAEGALGEALESVTDTGPGAAADGVTVGTTGELVRELAQGPLGEASGRGSAVISAEHPSELADWAVSEEGHGAFQIALPALSAILVEDESGALALADAATGTEGQYRLRGAEGCAGWPEVEVNVEGDVARGETAFGEVGGYLDAHLHMMAFEFLGGRARCGRPWHPYGVEHALSGCQEHELADGRAALLEMFLSGRDPVEGHDTNAGWPTFTDWPAWNSLTYEQVYYKWLERAWRGGLRMFVNLLVDNNKLCEVYPYKRNSCNEMDGVRLQEQRIRELERYIDAQEGGPGRGWFRIVADPFEARRVMNAGKLAVVLGIEVSVPLDCGVFLDIPGCDLEQIDEQLDEVYKLGVRQMELVNKFDNALSGVAGDAGELGVVVGTGNFLETGRFWQMETCDDDAHDHEHGHGPEHGPEHGHDKRQMNLHDDAGTPEGLTGRDALVGMILAATGTSGAAPLYPPGPHCNVRGVTDLGEHLVHRMIEKGMIFDPDHMSAIARAEAMDVIEEAGHSGVVSSHGWADETIYPRILRAGGVVTPYAGSSTGFVEEWRRHKEWIDDRYYFGFGFGADTNGFGAQGAPRGPELENPVTYPFEGFGGVTVHQQRSGERVYDINTDGVAHYGLYPDWIEDLRQIAGDEIVRDLERGPEAYLQMWERAVGIAPDSCRPDVPPLSPQDLAALDPAMSPEEVLLRLGQPAVRAGSTFTYCVSGDRVVAVAFDAAGKYADITVRPRAAGDPGRPVRGEGASAAHPAQAHAPGPGTGPLFPTGGGTPPPRSAEGSGWALWAGVIALLTGAALLVVALRRRAGRLT